MHFLTQYSTALHLQFNLPELETDHPTKKKKKKKRKERKKMGGKKIERDRGGATVLLNLRRKQSLT